MRESSLIPEIQEAPFGTPAPADLRAALEDFYLARQALRRSPATMDHCKYTAGDFVTGGAGLGAGGTGTLKVVIAEAAVDRSVLDPFCAARVSLQGASCPFPMESPPRILTRVPRVRELAAPMQCSTSAVSSSQGSESTRSSTCPRGSGCLASHIWSPKRCPSERQRMTCIPLVRTPRRIGKSAARQRGMRSIDYPLLPQK